jgi:hypothetical protein
MQNEEIEIKLWNYIDGTGTADDKAFAEHMISTHAAWKEKYEELTGLHQQLSLHLETEQPSLRFSKNVMDAIHATKVAPATKAYINKNIIRGIAAFFILAVLLPIAYSLATADYSTASSSLPIPDTRWLNDILTSNTFYVLSLVYIVLSLMLLDALLHKRHTNGTSHTHHP